MKFFIHCIITLCIVFSCSSKDEVEYPIKQNESNGSLKVCCSAKTFIENLINDSTNTQDKYIYLVFQNSKGEISEYTSKMTNQNDLLVSEDLKLKKGDYNVSCSFFCNQNLEKYKILGGQNVEGKSYFKIQIKDNQSYTYLLN
jgi:hypothetical protein